MRRREVHITRAFFIDERWVEVSPNARLLAIGLWSVSDADGVFAWYIGKLTGELIACEPIEEGLDDLADAGLVHRVGDIGRIVLLDPALKSTGRFVGARPIGSNWQGTRKRIIQRDGELCRYCGCKPDQIEIDHVVPVSRGGSSDDHNLAVACRPCNRDKGTKLLSEWLA